MMVDNVYILDNGAYTAKVELSKAASPRIIPNCIMKAKSERRRPFVGDQVEECRDASGLFYLLPFQKGFLINWDVQKTVWDYIFSKECCYGNFAETPLIVTEPCFNFPSIQEAMSEIFFEEYECQSLLRVNANCAVKEELQRIIDNLQFHDVFSDSLTLTESASYVLRYMSHRHIQEDDFKTILWEQNHNPLLLHSLYSNPSVPLEKPCWIKKVWSRQVCNLPNDQLFLELNLIPTLHLCLHYKHKTQRLLSELFHNTAKKSETICSAESLFEQIILEEFSDSSDQPINYSLKYFEHETPSILYSVEQPANFSLKYLEEIENGSLECLELMMFGAGETCYAETDLDQSPDVIFSCIERDDGKYCNDGSNFSLLNNYALSFSEELKEYHVEGTPCNYSVVNSLSGICSPAFVNEAKVETEKVSPNLDILSCSDMNQTEVCKRSEELMLETPLMFSRCSSVSSLTSVEPLDDVKSVVSDYSRLASGMISPSDLPDSPTQTCAPRLHSFILHHPQQSKCVFEEKVSVFREENTPVQFSTTSSLSALSFGENQIIETQSDLKFHNQCVVISEAESTIGKDDDDMLAACITAGMQSSKSFGNVNSEKCCEHLRKAKELSSNIKTSETGSEMPVTTSVFNSELLGNDTETLITEDTPQNITHSISYPDMAEDSNHIDILAECIQAGMPKAWRRTKCNVKKSGKVPLELPLPKAESLQSFGIQKPSCPSDNFMKMNDTLPVFKSGSAVKAYSYCNLVAPESCSIGQCPVPQETGKSPLNSPYETKIQLSRRSSIESLKEDSGEDLVTLSELLLLEQCITSGMPKKKTR